MLFLVFLVASLFYLYGDVFEICQKCYIFVNIKNGKTYKYFIRRHLRADPLLGKGTDILHRRLQFPEESERREDDPCQAHFRQGNREARQGSLLLSEDGR